MPKRLTPVTIITLLKKAKKTYQKEAPNPKDEAEQRHRKIDEDLKILRRYARKEESGADLENVFEARKLLCVKKLKVHRQKLKHTRDKDPNKEQLPKYLVALAKLTLSVNRLTFNTLSDEEEADLNPDALEAEREEDLRELDVEEPEDEAPATNGQARGDAAALVRRLNALGGPFKAAVTAQHPYVGRMQRLFVTVQGLLAKKDFDAAEANRVLDELEETLKIQPATAPAASAARPPISRVVFTQVRLAWDQTRKQIQAELQKLEKSILTTCQDQDDFNFADIATGTKKLYRILDSLDARLIDTLDDALEAATPEQQQQLQADAGRIVQEYLAFVNTDPLMAAIDVNGFTPLVVRQSALAALNLLASKL